MFGIESKFKCPCCTYTGIINLGITKFINIKGKGNHLAVRNCPKCNKTIAFEIQEEIIPLRHIIQISGNSAVITHIETLINTFPEEELKNESNIKDLVITNMKQKFGDAFTDKYYIEIIQLMELKLAEITTPEIMILSLDLDLIKKEDIQDDTVIAF